MVTLMGCQLTFCHVDKSEQLALSFCLTLRSLLKQKSYEACLSAILVSPVYLLPILQAAKSPKNMVQSMQVQPFQFSHVKDKVKRTHQKINGGKFLHEERRQALQKHKSNRVNILPQLAMLIQGMEHVEYLMCNIDDPKTLQKQKKRSQTRFYLVLGCHKVQTKAIFQQIKGNICSNGDHTKNKKKV